MESMTKTSQKNRTWRRRPGWFARGEPILLAAVPLIPFADAATSKVDVIVRPAHQILGEEESGLLGFKVANVGDLDRDGFDDLGVSIHHARADRPSHGKVVIYSAASWETIHEVTGDQSLDHLGYSIFGLFDVTGDGVPDFAVSAHRGGRNGGGYVRYHDGASGHAFDYAHGDSLDDEFGVLIATVGDVDADGFPDFGVSSRNDSNSYPFAGSVRLFSGRTRLGIRTLDGHGSWHRYGSAICTPGDVDGDGRDDYAVGARGAHVAGVHGGRAEIRSGVDHAILREIPGTLAGDNFGYSLAATDDHDGDGVRDFWVGSLHGRDQDGAATGAASLVSAATGVEITRLVGRPLLRPTPSIDDESFGCVISTIPDVDGDDLADVAIAAYRCDERHEMGGAVRVFGSRGFRLLRELSAPAPGARFGESAALLRQSTRIATLAIGAPYDPRRSDDGGSVSLFTIEPKP